MPAMPAILYPELAPPLRALYTGMTIRSPEGYPPDGFNIANDEHRRIFEANIAPRRLRSFPKQVHGNALCILKTEDEPPCAEGDGLITACPAILLGIRCADCAVVLLYDHKHSVLALLHSGWRGCAKNISGAAVARMQTEFHCRMEDIHAHVFPAAGPTSYEVGREVAELFPQPHRVVIRNERSYLDLHTIIHQQLEEAGMNGGSISHSPECTMSDTRFHSYRRDGKKFCSMLVFAGIGNKNQ